ncbi:MAG: cytochrome P460 family protein [Bacteroidales bacterium]|nr:cytochrome P460 family protein [Bacteroidales bacterium]
MKHTKILTLLALIIGSSLFIQSCSKDDDNGDQNNTNPEFVADDNTFTDFMTWQLEATNQGPDPALGMAHAGNDSTVTLVYFKDGQDPANGKYPVGTIIVKHSSNPDQSVNEFTAMVKRGNNFAPSGGDWEWFMLNPDGSIATDGDGNPMRGANLMGGMCISCHTQASNKDYVFSK